MNGYFELRQYAIAPGRMEDFRKHGLVKKSKAMSRAGIPTPMHQWVGFVGPITPQYACLLQWENLNDRMAAWGLFNADPAAQVADNGITRWTTSILRPSPVWEQVCTPMAPEPAKAVHDLRFLDVQNHDPAKAHDALGTTDLPFLVARGGVVLGVFATWFGTRMNQAVTLLTWPDHETMIAAYQAHLADPEINSIRNSERTANGRPLLRGTEAHLLHPIA